MILFSLVALPCCGDRIFSIIKQSFSKSTCVAVLNQSREESDRHGLAAILQDSLQLARIARADEANGTSTVVLALRPFTADGVLPRTSAMLRLRARLQDALATALRLPRRGVIFYLRGDVHEAFARVVERPELADLTLADLYDTSSSLETLYNRSPPPDTTVYATTVPVGAESAFVGCGPIASEVASALQRHVAEALVDATAHRAGSEIPGFGADHIWAPPVFTVSTHLDLALG